MIKRKVKIRLGYGHIGEYTSEVISEKIPAYWNKIFVGWTYQLSGLNGGNWCFEHEIIEWLD